MTDCAHPTRGRFCADCGKDLQPEPYDRRTVTAELAENWWEKGAVQTLAGLFIRPGTLIRTYVGQDRDLLVKPIPYAAVIIAFVYWVRARVPEIGNPDTAGSAALTLLMRDPLVPTVLSAMIGASIITFVTHRSVARSLYTMFVMRLYLAVQALLLMLGVKLVGLWLGVHRSSWFDPAEYIVIFGWMAWAIHQYFGPDQLRFSKLRAVAAVVMGEAALFLLLIIPIIIIDEAGWLN